MPDDRRPPGQPLFMRLVGLAGMSSVLVSWTTPYVTRVAGQHAIVDALAILLFGALALGMTAERAQSTVVDIVRAWLTRR